MTTAATNGVEISVVATLYQSEATVGQFCARAAAAARAQTPHYEVVLVNDGSRDRTLELALAARRDDPRVQVVDLSRNFGHHPAMMEGLRRSRGSLVFLIDSDLEDDPGALPQFDAERRRSGADVVYGVQVSRKGGWFERWTGALFYRLFNALSPVHLPRNIVTTRLMTRRYVDALLQHRERELFMAGVWLLTGFEQTPLPVQRGSRSGTTYTLASRVAQLVTAITSFTNRPLVLVFYVGVAISLVASLAAGYLIARSIFLDEFLAGWPSLIVSVWLLGGLTIASVGVVGIYLSRVFAEVKQRPATITRAVYGGDDRPAESREPSDASSRSPLSR